MTLAPGRVGLIVTPPGRWSTACAWPIYADVQRTHLPDEATPVARIPDKQEHQSKLMKLGFKERRAIVRAVNRGRAVENRAHAGLAVGVARRQQRFWKVAWLLGPILAAVQLIFSDVEAALINGAIGTVALGLMSAYWLWRAKRSEELNLALLEGRRSASSTRRPPPDDGSAGWTDRFRRSKGTPAPADDTPRPARPRGHLPGETGPRPSASRGSGTRGADGSANGAGPSGQKKPKPPQPRGKKRRR